MKCILSACAALTLGLPAAASTVLNGSFETGVPGNQPGFYNGIPFGALTTAGGGWDIYTGLDGWTSPATGVEVQTAHTLGLSAQDGDHYLELDTYANSSILQSVALSAGSYVLSFWYAPRTDDPATNGIKFTIGSIAGDLLVGFTERYQTTTMQWTNILASFDVEAAGTYDLRFAALGASDGYGGLLDNVAIAAEPSQVPLPAAGLMLAAALGGLRAMRRRKG